MPAIITNAFRTYNADNFISSFSTNKVYLMMEKLMLGLALIWVNIQKVHQVIQQFQHRLIRQ